jgi:hypothetical protein
MSTPPPAANERVVFTLGVRKSGHDVSEWLKSLALSQSELRAEQKRVLSKIGAGEEIGQGITEMAADIGFEPEPFTDDIEVG